MTGDWGSWRAQLERRGLTITAATTADASRPTAGATGGVPVNRALLDVGLDLDLATAGIGNGRLFVGYQHKGGGDGAACLEDGQGYSNIDAPDFRRVVEVWYERSLGTRARIKAGLNDANAEFAFVENGAEFINSSMGFSPSVFVMPTYPDPQLGIIVQTQPTSWSYAGAGIYNGGPALGVDDFKAVFAIAEAGMRWNRLGGGRVGFGYWQTRGRVPADDGAQASFSTGGQYVVMDQSLWSDGQSEHPRRVGAFVQLGFSDALVSPVARHMGAGIVATGLVPGRQDDVVGVAVTSIRFGEQTECPTTAGSETNVGAFYKFALTGWLALKPDLQVVMNPAGDRTRRTAVVSTLRFEVGF